jgi:hypothetical protein
MPHVDKKDAGLVIHGSARARHPVFRDPADKKIATGKLVTGQLELIPLERSTIGAPNANARGTPPPRSGVPPNGNASPDAALRDEGKRNHTGISGYAFCGTETFADMTSRRKEIRKISAITVAGAEGFARL